MRCCPLHCLDGSEMSHSYSGPIVSSSTLRNLLQSILGIVESPLQLLIQPLDLSAALNSWWQGLKKY